MEVDSSFRPTGVLKENQLMALRRAIMLQELYGDKIGRGFMDEVEILVHSDNRMWRGGGGRRDKANGGKKMTSLFSTSILKHGRWPWKGPCSKLHILEGFGTRPPFLQGNERFPWPAQDLTISTVLVAMELTLLPPWLYDPYWCMVLWIWMWCSIFMCSAIAHWSVVQGRYTTISTVLGATELTLLPPLIVWPILVYGVVDLDVMFPFDVLCHCAS